MKKHLALLAVAALALAACASSPTEAPDVSRIRSACAADAVLRPSITALLSVPGLATPQETGAVMAARAVIDPICANPAAAEQSAIAGLGNATGQVLAIYAELRARKAASAPG